METLKLEVEKYLDGRLRQTQSCELLQLNGLHISFKRGTIKIGELGDFIIYLRPTSYKKKTENIYQDDDALKLIQQILQNISSVSKVEDIGDLSCRLFLCRSGIFYNSLSKPFNLVAWLKSNRPSLNLNFSATISYESRCSSLTQARCCMIGMHIVELFRLAGITVSTCSSLNLKNEKSHLDEDVSSIDHDLVKEGICEKFHQNLKYNIVSIFKPIQNGALLLCSPIVNLNGETKLRMSPDQYISCIKDELSNASKHKYGDISGKKWDKLLLTAAESCQILQFMLVSHFSPIKVKIGENTNNSRASSFMLYNYARICVLMKNLQCLIDENQLPSMPPPENVDFSLLKHLEEWELCWIYIHKFPELLHDILDELIKHGIQASQLHIEQQANNVVDIQKEDLCISLKSISVSGNMDHILSASKINLGNMSNSKLRVRPLQFPTHKIAKFLHELSHCLSVYYNRVHILPSMATTKKHPVSFHLLPVLWARIYLLKTVQTVMETCFKTLSIIPPIVM